MNRKEFLDLSKAIIGGIACHGAFGQHANAQSAAGSGATVAHDADYYLEKGLTGMARAGGWFNAHWGAAVLAGHYLCQENQLGEETTAAIRLQLDALIASRASQFTPFPKEAADVSLVERVPEALYPAIKDGLRAHGHAVIFASLSTKALRDAPHMAQPRVIQGLCDLSRQIAKMAPQKSLLEASYENTSTMIEATVESLLRFKPLLGRPSVRRPNFTHMTTHTEALMNLEAMGYADLARAGHAGHQAHIAAPVPEFDPREHPVTDLQAPLEELTSETFWVDPRNVSRWNQAWNESSNPNGYWVAFGHLFKVLYSYERMIEHVKDEQKARLCSLIVLERYLNPAVQGG